MITFEMARAATAERSKQLVDFTQRIVATPSLSGLEGDVAAIIVAELKKLAFDEVWTDDVGNIIGKISGSSGPSIMLNGHMDVVDPGPADGWPYPAYSGAVIEGELWGRGSVDMKGPVASMIYAAAQFKQLNVKPAGDVLMTVAVMEEIGGLGSDFLVTHTSADAAIVGEPSRNELRLGHRGRIELQVKFHGRSAHASVPNLAVNPHFAAAEFLKALPNLKLGDDPILGPATIAPTLYQTDQQSANVIPSEVTLFLDWRNVPSETIDVAVEKIATFLSELSAASPIVKECRPEVAVTRADLKTYPGAVRNFASVFPAFATHPDSPIAQAAKKTIRGANGKLSSADASQGKVWQFATDGGHLNSAGIPCVGFGPGDDRLAHTNQERLGIADLEQSTATYSPLIVALGEALESGTS